MQKDKCVMYGGDARGEKIGWDCIWLNRREKRGENSLRYVFVSGTTENEGKLAREFISPTKVAGKPLFGFCPSFLGSTFVEGTT